MAILENEIVFGIVLYKEDLDNSVTFKSLVNTINEYKSKDDFRITVIIFDNTPCKESSQTNRYFQYNSKVEVIYHTKNENVGLPLAYNYFGQIAKKMEKTWLVLLDQDTELPGDFFFNYLNIDPSLKIHCPLIFNNGSLMSPSNYIAYRASLLPLPTTSKLDLKNVSCINSGLMINVDFFMKIGGYNEDLFLDFCDHDFILKVQQYDEKVIGVINCRLQQEFSAYVNSKEKALFRYKIFLKDMKVFSRNKSKIKIFFRLDLPRLLRLTYQYKSLLFLKIRLISIYKRNLYSFL